ncbi:MAG TPA: hypothetical protein VK498_01395, partial [Ferruginibacter sp.]|nr:hypothetical protein [Ferruginibacter sp.]
NINGPHQGGWVTTQTGEDWFLHFQDKNAYGRVVHLQPMKWVNDWPVIGVDKDGDGVGEPVLVYKKPNVGKIYSITTLRDSDEFNDPRLGFQWQWQANPDGKWAFPTTHGYIRMFSVYKPDSNLWISPNILAQKFPAEEFSATTKLDFNPLHENERFGLIVFGADYAYISIKKKADGNYITFNECLKGDKQSAEMETQVERFLGISVFLKVSVHSAAVCAFSYSENGKEFKAIGKSFIAKPGRWVGAKVGMFCSRVNNTNDAGFADIDWFRIEPLK